MDNLLKISAAVVSWSNPDCIHNKSNFYIDGRYKYEHETQSVEVSIENSASQYIFAVCNGLDRDIPEKNSSVSVVKEIKKFHEKIKGSTKDIEIKLDQLAECVEETNNIIHSIHLSDKDKKVKKTGFSGLMIADGKAAVLNLGMGKAYFLRNDMIKQLNGDDRKAERLLKLGIITTEQAEILSNQLGNNEEERTSDVKRSEIINLNEGDVFLLCSKSLSDVLDEDKIFEILSTNEECGCILNSLVNQVTKTGGYDDITVSLVKVKKINSKTREFAVTKNSNSIVKINKMSKISSKKIKEFKTYLYAAAACIVIIGIFIGIFKLLKSDDKDKANQTMASSTQVQSTLSNEGNSTQEPNEEVDNEEETGNGDEERKEPVKYKVQPGDSLINISKKFYNDPNKYKIIMEANGVKNPNRLQVGQELIIPGE